MEILSCFTLSDNRTYKKPKRNKKDIASFPEKISSLYLDYSVDFSRCLQENERIISGNVIINGSGLIINGVVANGVYLTAFISDGQTNNTYYLTFEAQTNLGGSFIQDMVLPVIGKQEAKAENYSFLTFTEKIKPSDKIPPFNAIKVNGRYLINENGLFYGV